MDSKEYELVCKQTWFTLIIDGSLKLFKTNDVLQKYLNLLKKENFDIYYLNCNEWLSVDSFEKDYMLKINGGELEKVAADISRALPDKEGAVLVLKNFDDYLSNYFDQSVKTLNLLNDLSWMYLMFGKKLIVLLNCNNNEINERLWDLNNTPIKQPMRGIGIRWIDCD